jgi:hypothetical protein
MKKAIYKILLVPVLFLSALFGWFFGKTGLFLYALGQWLLINNKASKSLLTDVFCRFRL